MITFNKLIVKLFNIVFFLQIQPYTNTSITPTITTFTTKIISLQLPPQTLLAAKSKELESEEHLNQVQQRETDNINQAIIKANKQLADVKEKKNSLQVAFKNFYLLLLLLLSHPRCLRMR